MKTEIRKGHWISQHRRFKWQTYQFDIYWIQPSESLQPVIAIPPWNIYQPNSVKVNLYAKFTCYLLIHETNKWANHNPHGWCTWSKRCKIHTKTLSTSSCHPDVSLPWRAGKRASSCPALKLENPKWWCKAVHRLEYATHPSFGADKLPPARGHAALHRNIGGASTTAVIHQVYTHFPTRIGVLRFQMDQWFCCPLK